MNRVLKVDFKSLIKQKSFIISITFMFLFGLYMAINSEEIDSLFNFTAIMGLTISIINSLLIGSDYNDGILRNKVIIGNKRTAIYLSSLINTFISSLFQIIAYIIPYILLSLLLGNKCALSLNTCLLLCIISILITFSYASIYTLISYIIGNKTTGAIICIILAICMEFMTLTLYSRLMEPEMYDEYVHVENGAMVTEEAVENSNYVSGIKRTIYEEILKIIPSGQSIIIMESNKSNVKYIIYSSLIIVFTSLGGIIIFNKKSLN